jgi:hypothetical protein
MPLFYFHLKDGAERHEDSEGVTLPDAEAAFYQAFRSARERLADAPPEPQLWLERHLEVEDESGNAVWSIPLNALVEIAA